MQTDFDENEIVIHNPPGCTCRRIIWLKETCDVFSLNILPGSALATLTADLGQIKFEKRFDYHSLSEEVAVAFWRIWHEWQPDKGIKIE